MTKQDYEEYDYIIGMDAWNLRNINRITGGDPDGKIHLLLDYSMMWRIANFFSARCGRVDVKFIF